MLHEDINYKGITIGMDTILTPCASYEFLSKVIDAAAAP